MSKFVPMYCYFNLLMGNIPSNCQTLVIDWALAHMQKGLTCARAYRPSLLSFKSQIAIGPKTLKFINHKSCSECFQVKYCHHWDDVNAPPDLLQSSCGFQISSLPSIRSLYLPIWPSRLRHFSDCHLNRASFFCAKFDQPIYCIYPLL